MTKWMVMAGLVVLNAVLGVGMYQHLMERPVLAQAAGARPDPAAVAGISNGQTVVYVLDATGILVAQRIDAVNGRIEAAGRRNVAQDLARVGQ